MTSALAIDGFAVVPALLPQASIASFLDELPDFEGTAGNLRRAGQRNLLSSHVVLEFAGQSEVMSLVKDALGSGAIPVRALLFDKSPDANWLVPWHQDLTVCARERRDVPGYGPWSVKEGVSHVQPPVGVLERMLAVRIHLDDCDEANGGLRILPGTHLRGRLNAEQIAEAASTIASQCYPLSRGGAMLMKPLLLHSSPRAAYPSQRRVLHIEYANCALDGGLEWYRA